MHKKKIYMSLLEDSLLEHFPSEFNPTSPHEISNDSTEPENSLNPEENIYSNTTLNLLDSAAFLFEEDDGACDRANEQLKDILESARQLHADVLALKGAVNGQSSRISDLKVSKEAKNGERTVGSLRKSKFKYSNSSDSGLNEKRKDRKSKDETHDFIHENMFEISPVLSTPPSYPKKDNESEYLKATSGKDHFSSGSSLLSGEFFTKSSNSERSGDRKFYTDRKSTFTNKPLIEIKPYSEYKPLTDRRPFIPFLDAKPPIPKSNKYESKKNEPSRLDLTRNEPLRYESKVSKIINSKILKPTPILYDPKYSRQKSQTELPKPKSKTTKKSKKSNESGNSSGSSQPIVVDIELPKLVKIRRYKSATTKHPSSRKSERGSKVVADGTKTAGTGTAGTGRTGTGLDAGLFGYGRHGFGKNTFESRFGTNGMERRESGTSQRVGLENYFQNQGRSHTLTNLLDEKSSRSKNRDSEKSKMDTQTPKKFVSPGGTTYAEKKVNKKKLTKSKSINYSKSSRPELIPIKPSSSPTYKYHKSSTVAKYQFAERGLSLVSSSSDEVSHRPPLVIVSSRKRNDDQF